MRRLAVVLVVAACGDNAAPHFSRDFHRAQCDYDVRCGLARNVDDCVSFVEQLTPADDSVRAAIEHGTIVFDSQAAERCLDAYQIVSCDRTEEQAGQFAACSDVFLGQLEDGETCAFSLECTSGRCDTADCADGTCCSGTCKPARAIPGDGEACTSVCQDGLYCGADDLCHPYGEATEPCDDVHPCNAALYCGGRTTNAAGTCMPLPHLGEPCELGCAEVSATCRDGTCVEVSVGGQPCERAQDCSTYYWCQNGSCGSYPGLGESCAESHYCAIGYGCDGTQCVRLEPAGKPCAGNTECESSYCSDAKICIDLPICY